MNQSAHSHPSVELVAAGLESRVVIENLLELYCHDFSEWTDVQIGPDGRFGYKEIHTYWSEQDRKPFLIFSESKLAGFALIKRMENSVWDIAEFFVLRGYRRCGVGMAALHLLYQRCPGNWRVRVMERNRPTRLFWMRAIENLAPIDLVERQMGSDWIVLEFSSPKP